MMFSYIPYINKFNYLKNKWSVTFISLKFIFLLNFQICHFFLNLHVTWDLNKKLYMIAIFISCMPLHTLYNYASNPIYFIKFTCPSIFLFVLWFYHFLTFLIICMSLDVNKKIHPWCYSLVIHFKWYYMQLSIKWMAMQCYSIKIQFFICFTKYIFFEIFIIKI